MEIVEFENRNRLIINELLKIWENSVRKTHLFLSDDEIEKIKQYVPQALNSIKHLIVARSEHGYFVGFAGVEGKKLKMLFVAAKNIGTGVGKQLIKYAIDNYSVNELTVNEQNLQAIRFYEHMGFVTYKRSDIDEQGNPYPILFMKREK